MSATAALSEQDLSVTSIAQTKMAELAGQVEEDIAGIRVYAMPGGCSGVSFGMTFTDQVNENDGVLDCNDIKVIIDTGSMQYLQGVEIDFVDRGDGNATFVFNNLQPVGGGGGCGTCGSGSGGGCG